MCIRPLTIDGNTFSCGQCSECLIKKSMEWAFRCEWETKVSTSGAYVTLTYDEQEVPQVMNNEGEVVGSLWKKDLQLFLKRLRKRQEKFTEEKIRFFACGEYGEKTKRPHYHLLIWNIHPKTRKEIDQAWTKGFVKVGDVEPKSIRYVTNYMMKKNVDAPRGAVPYFTQMSRKPGIGYAYVTKAKHYHEFHETGLTLMAKPLEERPFLPDYYARKIFNKSMGKFQRQKQEAFEEYNAILHSQAQQERPDDPWGFLVEKKKQSEERRKRIKEKLTKNKVRL